MPRGERAGRPEHQSLQPVGSREAAVPPGHQSCPASRGLESFPPRQGRRRMKVRSGEVGQTRAYEAVNEAKNSPEVNWVLSWKRKGLQERLGKVTGIK